MMPFARRMTAKLQAARRLLTGDRQLEDEPPDDTERLTRLPAAEDVCHSSAAHRDLEEKKKEMRRAVSDTKSQTAALMSTMTAVHDSLQAQEFDAAARPLRTAQHAARAANRNRKRGRTTSQVQQQQQRHIKGVSQGCRTTSQVQQQQHIKGISQE